MTENEGQILIETAKEAILSKLEKREALFPKDIWSITEKQGVFVTLHKKGQLRGCIGRIISDEALCDIIEEVSHSSAFQDPRFKPLEKEEWNEIDVEITILSPLIPVKSIDEIVIGRDGLLIRKGYHSGVFLPQVPVEQNWDLDEYLENLCYKAGMNGDCWQSKETKLYRFSGQIFHEQKQ